MRKQLKVFSHYLPLRLALKRFFFPLLPILYIPNKAPTKNKKNKFKIENNLRTTRHKIYENTSFHRPVFSCVMAES